MDFEFNTKINRYCLVLLFIVVGFGSTWYVHGMMKDLEVLSLYFDENKGKLDDTDTSLFPQKIDTVDFYYRGNISSCWYMGKARDLSNAVYFFKDYRGRVITEQNPIVYIKPEEERYSQFWQVFYVHVPKRYTPNSVKSIDTILKGEKDKIFSVEFTDRVLNMPFVNQDVEIKSNTSDYPKKITGYYQSQEATFLIFEDNLLAYDSGAIANMPAIAIYREGDYSSMFEAMLNKDLNDNGSLKDSFNLIDSKKGSLDYSPLHKLSYIHVNSDYSDLSGDNPEWKSFTDMVQNKGEYINFDKGGGGLEETNFFFNCPQVN